MKAGDKIKKKRPAHYQKERGEAPKRRILALIKITPMTVAEIAAAVFLSRASVQRHLREMRRETPKRAYVAGYQRSSDGLKPPRKFAAGSRKDAPAGRRPRPKVESPADMRIRQILEFLQLPQTTEELAAKTGITDSQVNFYLRQLRTEMPKRVYIKAWRPPSGRGSPAPVHALGNHPDAPLVRLSRMRKPAISTPSARHVFAALGL